MRVLRYKGHLLRDHTHASPWLDYRGTNTAITYVEYHTSRHISVHSEIHKISRHHVYILSTIYLKIY